MKRTLELEAVETVDEAEVAAEEPSGSKMDDDDGGGCGEAKDDGAAILAFGRQTRLELEGTLSPPPSPPSSPPGESTPVAGEREDSVTRRVATPSLDKPSLASISLAVEDAAAVDAEGVGGGGAGDIKGTLKEEPSRARIDFRHFARRF